MLLPADTPVIDDATGEVEWTGPVSDFEQANEIDAAASTSLRTELALTRRSFIGGGAAPLYRVEVIR